MSSCCAASELRRARPLLGTFVEVTVRGLSDEAAARAIDRAMRAVARVHRLMSPRLADSDLGRLNRLSPGETLTVDPWTWRVLAEALELARRSGGAFDPSLPCARGATVAPGPSPWRALELRDHHVVRARRPLRLDLGGIAKGFAVDLAVEVLRDEGAHAGVVNAGGDLRVFGDVAHRVDLRLPSAPRRAVPAVALADGALATSANYLDEPGRGRVQAPRGFRLRLRGGSATVCAPRCVHADALCKVVAVLGLRKAAPLLAHFQALAFVLDADGSVSSNSAELGPGHTRPGTRAA